MTPSDDKHDAADLIELTRLQVQSEGDQRPLWHWQTRARIGTSLLLVGLIAVNNLLPSRSAAGETMAGQIMFGVGLGVLLAGLLLRPDASAHRRLDAMAELLRRLDLTK